jgi:hypothetical protein
MFKGLDAALLPSEPAELQSVVSRTHEWQTRIYAIRSLCNLGRRAAILRLRINPLSGGFVFEIRSESFDLLSAVSQHNWIVGLGLGGKSLTALIDRAQLSSQRGAYAIQRAVKLGGGGDGIAFRV